jgi:hypothetical protein
MVTSGLDDSLRPGRCSLILGGVGTAFVLFGFWLPGPALAQLTDETPPEAASESAPAAEAKIEVVAPRGIAPSEKKLPIPSAAEIARAEALVKEIFGSEIAEAKSAEQRSDLAGRMMESADGTDAKDSARYVLLMKATELAGQAGNGRLIENTCDSLHENYEVDVLKLKGRAFSDATKVNLDIQVSGAMSEQVLALAEQAAAQQRFDLAQPLLKVAQIFSRKVKSKDLNKQINLLSDRLAALQKDFQAAEKAAQVLKGNPNDAAANLAYGKFLAIGKRDWQKALPLLAKGGVAAIKSAADADLAKPSTATEQANVGDAWYALAKGDKTLEGFLGRAHYWYDLSLPTVTGLTKTRVEKRLEETSSFASSSAETVGKMGPITAKLRLTIPSNTDSIQAIAFSQNGRTLASGGYDNNIHLWDVTTGESIKTINVGSGIRSLLFLADGKTLISCSSDHITRFWSIPAGELQQKFDDSLTVVASADRKTLAAYHPRAGTITIWDGALAQQRGTLEKVNRCGPPQISADGKVVVCTSDEIINVWNVPTGRLIHKLPAKVMKLTLSLDGRMLATADYEGRVTIWNLTTGAVKHSITADESYVNAMALSPDGETLVTGGATRALRFWDPHAGKLRVDVPDEYGFFSGIVFSPNGKTICTTNESYQLNLWDVQKLPSTGGAPKK